MREALITDVDGFITDVELVAYEGDEALRIYGPSEEEDGDPVLTGYVVTVRVPEGMYKPKWNPDSEAWEEGLSAEEIEEVKKPKPVEKSADQKEIEKLRDMMTQMSNEFTLLLESLTIV